MADITELLENTNLVKHYVRYYPPQEKEDVMQSFYQYVLKQKNFDMNWCNNVFKQFRFQYFNLEKKRSRNSHFGLDKFSILYQDRYEELTRDQKLKVEDDNAEEFGLDRHLDELKIIKEMRSSVKGKDKITFKMMYLSAQGYITREILKMMRLKISEKVANERMRELRAKLKKKFKEYEVY